MKTIAKLTLFIGILLRLGIFIFAGNNIYWLCVSLAILLTTYFFADRLVNYELFGKKNEYRSVPLIAVSVAALIPALTYLSTARELILLVLVPLVVVTLYLTYWRKRAAGIVLVPVLLLLYPLVISSISAMRVVNPPILKHHENIINDIGVINSINELRGEDSNELIARGLHNKMLFLSKYAENSIALSKLSIMASTVLVVNLVPLLVGIYYFAYKLFKKEKIFVFWVLGAILPAGLLPNTISGVYLIYLVPTVVILVALGVKKLNWAWLLLLMLINFIGVAYINYSV